MLPFVTRKALLYHYSTFSGNSQAKTGCKNQEISSRELVLDQNPTNSVEIVTALLYQ